jgi:hypothetical protein
MSDHMADLYAKQFDVWEQVSRRSSLSALALAATSPRYASTPPTFFYDYMDVTIVVLSYNTGQDRRKWT